ncbi:MAG: toll/interleukin-1 receptor domain-containing protein, partial [Pseudomonadota bacterium]|nr:toll/interleukin-1 receptor domain-containing protein [Pseudomonadota bacterium]
MAKLFLSYSREDTGQVRPIAACLERAGHEVWWDQHISGGEQFADAIEKALHDADVIVAIWSEAAARSAWVRDEAAAGRDSGR